jgi:Family of unknown function (DUF5361)
VAGFTWADIGTARLPFDQFVSFVMHAPPGTALYHAFGRGWTVTDHLLTDALEMLDWLAWTKTEDGQHKPPRKRPKRRPRPGEETQKKQAHQQMTVGEYMERSGMSFSFGEGGE